MSKYNITNETKVHNGVTLHKIERVYTKTPGGWLESEKNLSQEGNCFIRDNAMVYGNARVTGNAVVSEDAEVYGDAIIRDNAKVYGKTIINDHAIIEHNAQIYGYAKITGNTIVSNDESVFEYIGTWDEIDYIERLDIYVGNDDKKGIICSNGYHQIPIKVYFEAFDKDKKRIKVRSSDIFNHIRIVDSKNKPFTDAEGFSFTQEAGGFVCPKLRGPMNMIGSSCYFYASLDLNLDKKIEYVRLFVQCTVNGKEYTTAIENTESLFVQNFVMLYVYPRRVFSQNDIDVTSVTETELVKDDFYIEGRDVLKKYYVRFKNNEKFITNSASYQTNNIFYFKQMASSKHCYSSTDLFITEDKKALFTMTFNYKSNQSFSITSTNHDMPGLCFWHYTFWEREDFYYHEWGNKMDFILYDQYGNKADMVVQPDENNKKLSFHVKE